MSNKPIRSRDNFLVFGRPFIGNDEITEVVDSLKSGWIGTGPKVAQFEDDFSDYKGANSAVALNSCTAALHLAMIAADIGPGDEVITTPLTFCATVNAIIHSGATPVLADIDPVSMNIDPPEIEKKITSKTKAILPVHFAGRPCEMESISEIAQANALTVIEDCAHAIETEYHGQKAGTIGDFGCFSFYVTKNITTAEGGMVVARTQGDLDRVKTLALHGMSADAWSRYGDEGYKHYFVVEPGYKYNMTDIQASLGIHQLKRIHQNWERRKEIWNIYNDALQDLPITLPPPTEPGTKHAYHLYTLLIDKERCGITRDEFLNAITKENIGAGVHYDSIPEHPYYRDKFNWQSSDYPNAERIGKQTVSIPLSSTLSDHDVNDVIKAVSLIL